MARRRGPLFFQVFPLWREGQGWSLSNHEFSGSDSVWLTRHLGANDMRTQLTKRIVATAQPAAKPYEIRDILIRGLILRVQPSGHKAWIVTWAHGKRRTLGPASLLSLEQARAHAAHTLAEAVQTGLPSIAKKKLATCTLNAFLAEHYEPWAIVELRRGARYAQRIRTQFAGMLKKPNADIDAPMIDRWWRDRLTDDGDSAARRVARSRYAVALVTRALNPIITVQAGNAKNGRQRHLPLNVEALSVVTKWHRQTNGQGQVFEPQDVKKGWNALLDEAGIAAFRFHDLRHHFASRLVMEGVDLNTVRELLGHSDLKMTLRYAHLAPEHLSAAVAKLAG